MGAVISLFLVAVILVILISTLEYILFKYKSYHTELQFESKHCYITGGSSGLGRALAIELAKRGANITIVARDQQKLHETISELKKEVVTRSKQQQKFSFISADISSPIESESAIYKANISELGPIDWVFTCAGASIPGFFHQQPMDDFSKGINLNYLGTLYTLKAALTSWYGNFDAKTEHTQSNLIHKQNQSNSTRFLLTGKEKRIVIISSTLGLTGLVGYSQYVPTKYALRGLAEVLRQEYLHKINIHIYFVSTINTPGYVTEQLTKPEITTKIEGEPTGLDSTPKARAITLLNGIKDNRFMIVSDWDTYALMLSSAGTAPRHLIGEYLLAPFAIIICSIWRSYCDWLVKNKK